MMGIRIVRLLWVIEQLVLMIILIYVDIMTLEATVLKYWIHHLMENGRLQPCTDKRKFTCEKPKGQNYFCCYCLL